MVPSVSSSAHPVILLSVSTIAHFSPDLSLNSASLSFIFSSAPSTLVTSSSYVNTITSSLGVLPVSTVPSPLWLGLFANSRYTSFSFPGSPTCADELSVAVYSTTILLFAVTPVIPLTLSDDTVREWSCLSNINFCVISTLSSPSLSR